MQTIVKQELLIPTYISKNLKNDWCNATELCMETKMWTSDFSLVNENDSRVVSYEYSAYPGDETNEFPVL